MKATHRSIELIKRYEGFKDKPYYCLAGQLTIGYGHTIAEGEKFDRLSESEATALLLNDIRRFEIAINRAVKVPLTQGHFDALISLVFNWGEQAFLNSQGLKELNLGRYEEAAKQFFSRDKGVVKVLSRSTGKLEFLQGLYNRRLAESELWNEA